MPVVRLRSALLIAAASVGLGGCATYSPYGYGSGVSVGIGNAGYYDPYYSRYGSRYGYGYGSPYGYGYSPYGYGYGSGYGYSPYYGWHNGYYYPGTGYYVYDQYRRRRTLTDTERAYWEQRARQPGMTTTRRLLDNWSGYAQSGTQATQGTQSTRSIESVRTMPSSERTFRVRRSEEIRERAISRRERAAARDLNSTENPEE